MLRWDEAWFIVVALAVVCLLALGATELLAQALQPVSEALMQGTEAITVEVTP